MIKSSVTIALVDEVKSGPWIYWEKPEVSIPKASRLGFHAVELFCAPEDPSYIKALTDENDIRVSAVGTGVGKVLKGLTLSDPDPGIRKAALSFVKEVIEFGAAFNAPAIIGSMQGNAGPVSKEQAIDWLGDAVDQLAEFAASKNVHLIFEPINRYESNLFNQLDDAANFVNSLSNRNVRILADLFHMNIEEASIAGSIKKYASLIGHVHFADSNRKPVGFGHIPMEEVAAALKESGYDGYVSAEALPWPDSDSAAKKTMESYRKYFG